MLDEFVFFFKVIGLANTLGLACGFFEKISTCGGI